jgi:Putative zinc-finger
MSEINCDLARESSAEYALGILPPDQRRAVAEHLLGCPTCRREVDEMGEIGDQLVGLIPDTEPPLGFDRRVLSRVDSTRRRPRRIRWVIGASVAAACIAVAALVAPEVSSNHHAGTSEALAVLRTNGEMVGSVYIDGHPPWVEMSVHGIGVTGPVSCELVNPDGSTTTIGTFDLVGGSGSWGAPLGEASSDPSAARLVDSSGHVIASASFG